jgi:DNA-binding MarR family transcriptional regulator
MVSGAAGKYRYSRPVVREGEGHMYPPPRLRELLHRHSLASQRLREAVARALGIPAADANALAYLSLGRALTPTALGGQLGLTSGGTTALVHRLEARGYAERSANAGDARSCLLVLTASAAADLGRDYASVVADLDELIATLSDDERAVIGRFLHAVRERADAATEARSRTVAQRQHEQAGSAAPGLWV